MKKLRETVPYLVHIPYPVQLVSGVTYQKAVFMAEERAQSVISSYIVYQPGQVSSSLGNYYCLHFTVWYAVEIMLFWLLLHFFLVSFGSSFDTGCGPILLLS